MTELCAFLAGCVVGGCVVRMWWMSRNHPETE